MSDNLDEPRERPELPNARQIAQGYINRTKGILHIFKDRKEAGFDPTDDTIMNTAERAIAESGLLGNYQPVDMPWLDQNIMQTQVKIFMLEKEQVIGDTPALRDTVLRLYLMRQEAKETFDAIDAGDLVEAIDGLADMLYVIFGTFVAFGVNAQEVFNMVHQTNMEKSKQKKDDRGKVLKPEGWKPPAIREYLIANGWKEDEDNA